MEDRVAVGGEPAGAGKLHEQRIGVVQPRTRLVADLDKLPASAQELAQPWRKKALARAAAIDAARHLAAVAFAQLGEAPDLAPR